MKNAQLTQSINYLLSNFPNMSKKVAKEIAMERIEKDKREAFIAGVRKNIEAFLTSKGFDFSFITLSETSFGTSIYYRVGEVKYRFSDHSVTNHDRVMDEVHYSYLDFSA